MKNRLLKTLPICLLLLTGCNLSTPDYDTGNIKVIQDTKFDSIYGDMLLPRFLDKGFSFGDSVDVTFSNGKKFEDIPFYDGYYVKIGAPLVVGYPGYPYIDVATNNKAGLWQSMEFKDGDTMRITLNEKGKYLTQQETFSMAYFDDREDYTTDEEFANFRAINLSTMKADTFYRGASPVDNQHNRAKYSASLIEEHGVKFILNLADSEEDLEYYSTTPDYPIPEYSKNLYLDGKMALLNMGVDFTTSVFQTKLATGLTELIKNEGPYYIHCTEGKDRTGFVCFLLGALSGATYEELEKDYMETYKNYYGITKEKDEAKYNAVADLRFKDFCNYLTPSNDGSYLGDRGPLLGLFYSEGTTPKSAAIDYLLAGGMTQADIDTLISIL